MHRDAVGVGPGAPSSMESVSGLSISPAFPAEALDPAAPAAEPCAMSERTGFSAADWREAPVFKDRCAMPLDLEQGDAVFALSDTLNGRPVQMPLPKPVIWYAEDEQYAALVVQAEHHEDQDDGDLEFLGLLLPNGQTAVVVEDDLEFVDTDDPVWLSLLEADSDASDEL
jgi:hypothetical protein